MQLVPEDEGRLELHEGQALPLWISIVDMVLKEVKRPSLGEWETILEKYPEWGGDEYAPYHLPRFRSRVNSDGTDAILQSEVAKADKGALRNLLTVLRGEIVFVLKSAKALDLFCTTLTDLYGKNQIPDPRVEIHMFKDVKFRGMKVTDDIWTDFLKDAEMTSAHGEAEGASQHVQEWMNTISKHDFLGKNWPVEIILHRPWLNMSQLKIHTRVLRKTQRRHVVKIDTPSWKQRLEDTFHPFIHWTTLAFEGR